MRFKIIYFLLLILYNTHEIKSTVFWAGGVTSSSVTIAVKPNFSGKLVISEDMQMKNVFTAIQLENNNLRKFNITNLSSNQRYYYQMNNDDSLIGTFMTFQQNDVAMSFQVAFASCALTNSNAYAFKEIAEKDNLFFIHMGDMHYEDINSDDESLYSGAYESVHTSSNQALLYLSTPIVYMWDDHDYGLNNADGTYYGRNAAARAYEKYVPHYPFQAISRQNTNSTKSSTTINRSGIYQAFTVGKVRFVITDLRSESNVNTTTGYYTGFDQSSMMSEEQFSWFENELDNAHSYSMVVWVTTKPFNGLDEELESNERKDGWNNYPKDRNRIANLIQQYNVSNIVALAGDGHLLGIDSGIYNDFSDNDGGWGFPVFQAAPLDNYGSFKGGPYSEGCAGWELWKSSNYGVMKINDQSDVDGSVCLTWEGYQVDQGSNNKVLSFSTCTPFNKKGYPATTDTIQSGACVSLPLFPPLGWVVVISVPVFIGTLIFFVIRYKRRKGILGCDIAGRKSTEMRRMDDTQAL